MNFKTQTTENKIHYSKSACIVFLFSVVFTLVLADNQNRQTLKAGLEAVNQGNINKAIRIFQQAIRENPRDQYAYYYLNKSYQEIGNLAKALEACQHTLKIKQLELFIDLMLLMQNILTVVITMVKESIL